MATTVAQLRIRLSRWVQNTLPGVLEDAAREADTRIGARAVSTYMREDRFGGRRSPNDRGPLRRISGKTARAAVGAGRNGAILRFTPLGLGRLRLTKGIDAQVAPGAYNEGRKARSGVMLSFMGPALKDERTWIKRRASLLASQSLRRALGGASLRAA